MPIQTTQSLAVPARDRDLASVAAPGAGTAHRPRILFLDTEEMSALAIQQTLLPCCATIQIATSANQVRIHLTENSWDIFLVHLDSQKAFCLEALRFVQGSGLLLARIALLDQIDSSLLAASLPLELDAFLIPPLTADRLRDTVERCYVNILQQRQEARVTASMREQIVQLKTGQSQLLAEIDHLEQSVMEALLATLAMREADSVLHALRVQAYASYFARLVNYPESLRPHLEHAALLHDIGKIGLSDALLFRQGALSATEVERMQSHTTVGEQILNRIHFLRPAAQIVRHHHERFDGQGFPDHLQGDKIPLGSRIFSIVDTLDAITSDRLYRPAQSFEKAQQEVERCAGSHFDPRLAAAFLQVSTASWTLLRRQVEEAYAQRPSLLTLASQFPPA